MALWNFLFLGVVLRCHSIVCFSEWWIQVSSSMTICDSKSSPPVSQKISDGHFPCPFACICQNSWHPTSTDFWTAELFNNCITLLSPMDSRNTTHLFLCDGHSVSVHEAGRCCEESVQCMCTRPFVVCHEVLLLLSQLIYSIFPIIKQLSHPHQLDRALSANVHECKSASHLQQPKMLSLLTVSTAPKSLPIQNRLWWCHLLSETVGTNRT